MGAPAVVRDHQIMGSCTHTVPVGNASGPMAFLFTAPLKDGLVDSVLIAGQPAAVEGSSGVQTPPHAPPLHPSDPFFEKGGPRVQVGKITKGSATVYFGGRPAASIASKAQCCRPEPAGKLGPGIPTVEIG